MKKSSLFHGNLVSTNRILYTPSAFARNSLIHLQETGTLKAQSPHTSKRSHLDSYLFILVTAGAGNLTYNGQKYELSAGDCVFIDCKLPYSHTTSNDLWSLQWVHFYGTNMADIYAKYVERGGEPVFRSNNTAIYSSMLSELYEIAESEDYLRDMKIYQKLISLLTLLLEDSWHPENSHRQSPKKANLIELREYLDEHYLEHHSLDELSERFFINKFYLTRIFKEQFGISINSYITSLRITHAKQLLRFTNMSTSEIAESCGMPDANYFSRIFKKVEGITPGQFRKQW